MAKRAFHANNWTPTATADTAAHANATYQALKGGSSTQLINIVEVSVSGLAAASSHRHLSAGARQHDRDDANRARGSQLGRPAASVNGGARRASGCLRSGCGRSAAVCDHDRCQARTRPQRLRRNLSMAGRARRGVGPNRQHGVSRRKHPVELHGRRHGRRQQPHHLRAILTISAPQRGAGLCWDQVDLVASRWK